MAEISQIEVNNTTYNVYDAAAQDCLSDTDLINGNLNLNEGRIQIKDNDIEVGTVPSSDQYAPVVEWVDINNIQMGYVHTQYTNNDEIRTALGTHRDINGTDIYRSIWLSTDSSGKAKFIIPRYLDDSYCDLEVWGELAAKRNLNVTGNAEIGGTLDVTNTTTHNNNILLINSSMDRDGAIPSSEQDRYIAVRDKDNESVAALRGVIGSTTAGNMGAQVVGYGEDSGGTTVANRLGVYVNRSGDCVYTLSDPAAFCSALRVGNRVEKDQSTAVSIADSSWKNICSISLAAGTWIIEATVQYAANATGRRSIAISETTNAASAAVQRETCSSITAINGASTFIHTGCTKVLTATTTIYLVGWQNSGAALNTYGYISAVRIK